MAQHFQPHSNSIGIQFRLNWKKIITQICWHNACVCLSGFLPFSIEFLASEKSIDELQTCTNCIEFSPILTLSVLKSLLPLPKCVQTILLTNTWCVFVRNVVELPWLPPLMKYMFKKLMYVEFGSLLAVLSTAKQDYCTYLYWTLIATGHVVLHRVVKELSQCSISHIRSNLSLATNTVCLSLRKIIVSGRLVILFEDGSLCLLRCLWWSRKHGVGRWEAVRASKFGSLHRV